MFYDAELEFLQSILRKSRLRTLRLSADVPADERLDDGLRTRLGLGDDYVRVFDRALAVVEPNTICRLTDQFLCSYIFLRLPGAQVGEILCIGPYLSVELTRQQHMEQAESSGVQPQQFPVLEAFYGSIPVVRDDNLIFAPVVAFGERIWGGGDAFAITDLNREFYDSAPRALGDGADAPPPEKVLHTMQEMEERYAFENEFMQAVSLGQTHRAGMMLSGFSSMAFERRLADPVRNLKNYCITMNTLLRKAAEQGGVHPLYLDEQSSSFARRIEELNSVEAAGKMMDEMFRTYCRLVRQKSTKDYSPPVQRAVVQIDADLSGDLSLRTLALTQNINASYLSVLFKKETGMTVTDYVNRRRVAVAAQLLGGTKLQIQTVAQHCGMTDANYFSKIFKKYTGATPREYRLRLQGGRTPRQS